MEQAEKRKQSMNQAGEMDWSDIWGESGACFVACQPKQLASTETVHPQANKTSSALLDITNYEEV